jgi:2-aminoadipate transaminase
MPLMSTETPDRRAMTVAGDAGPGASVPEGAGEVLDLGAGHPDPALLPAHLLRRAAATVLADEGRAVLGYGPERGAAEFRSALAGFLERQTGGASDPERLFVTAGASMALDLLCTLLTTPGDTVVVGEPTYHLALRTFRDHGLQVEGVPSDADGVDVADLERLLTERRVRLVYLMPSFANPDGSSLSAARRARVVELAHEHDVWVVADDVYQLLPLAGAPSPGFPLGASKVLTLGSFSKVLAPGLRLGWIEGDPDVLARLEASGVLQSGGGLNPVPEALVGELLHDGSLDEHLVRLRSAYAERALALTAAVRRDIPQARFHPPQGGYFVWLRLPGVDADTLLATALASGVRFQPGSRFSHRDALHDRVRLSFSRYPAAIAAEGVRRLAEAVESRHQALAESAR